MDPRSGFSSRTNTFRSLRPRPPLPPENQTLTITTYAFSQFRSVLPTTNAFVDADTGATLSYIEFRSQIVSLTSVLRSPEVNITRGDVAFVLSLTRLEIPVLYFSLLSIGAVVCPSNPVCTRSEIYRHVHLVKPSVVFADSASAGLLPPSIRVVLIDSPQFRSFLTGGGGKVDEKEDVTVEQSDTAVILFSSGTTGCAKAAASTHRNYIVMIAGFLAARGVGSGSSPETMVLTAPMFHSLGFFQTLKGVALGDTTVIMGRPTLSKIIGAADRYRATKITAAPPVIVMMWRSKKMSSYNLSSVRGIFTGGSSIQLAVAQLFLSRFPNIAIEQAYGSTEGGAIARMITGEECRNLRSVGRLNESFEAKIVDPVSGKALQVGKEGELLIRGPVIMKGYVGDAEATDGCIDSKGWMKTGDLCCFDHDGYLYIVDRIKELIKYKSYQVPPAELEQLLLSLPEIADAAVIPYPDEEAGEVPMACVVRQLQSKITESQVMGFVAKQVAPYKKIRMVAFVKSIPKSPSGKILRRVLISHATSSFRSKF